MKVWKIRRWDIVSDIKVDMGFVTNLNVTATATKYGKLFYSENLVKKNLQKMTDNYSRRYEGEPKVIGEIVEFELTEV